MPAPQVSISNKPIIDFQDKVGSATISASATGTKLTFDNSQTFFVTRTGARPFLAQVANAVSSGGEDKITFHVYVNGNRIAKVPFDNFQQALGETYRSDGRLASPLELPQGALIEVLADNSDGSTSYSAFARLRVEYEDLN